MAIVVTVGVNSSAPAVAFIFVIATWSALRSFVLTSKLVIGTR